MSTAITSYCSDEDLAIRATGDFPLIAPASQRLASGSDGVFLAADRWTLVSAGTNFGGAGIGPGHVVLLGKPTSTLVFDQQLGITTVAGNAATLRRIGMEADQGDPPAPAAGWTGVRFEVRTLYPQIQAASYELSRRFAIDPAIPGRMPIDLYDLRDLRHAAVLWVLWHQYESMSRTAGGSENQNDFIIKSRTAKAEYDALVPRLDVRWTVAIQSDQPRPVFPSVTLSR